MDLKVKRYFHLKLTQKEIEQELVELRSEIMHYCAEQGITEFETGGYYVKIVHQERKEYDDNLLYDALPDVAIWRMLSKADPSKIASMIKLNVLKEEAIQDTYRVKNVELLQVGRK